MTFRTTIFLFILPTLNTSYCHTINSLCSPPTENTHPCCDTMNNAKEIMSIIKIPRFLKSKKFSNEFRIALQLISTIYYKKYSTKIQFRRNINLNNKSVQFANSLKDILNYFQNTGYCLSFKRKTYYDILLYNPQAKMLMCDNRILFKEVNEQRYFNGFVNGLNEYKGNILMYRKRINRHKINQSKSVEVAVLNLLLIEKYLETKWFKSYKAYFANDKNEIEIYTMVVSKNENMDKVYINHFHYKWFFIK
eukprot:GAHX01003238.1.p1 GENE.GAHX01003238.1~~GAHX01003238.1.p1  ORF type:complete len:250 (+),score=28.98 GAHX01003238.1:469-1218(+)